LIGDLPARTGEGIVTGAERIVTDVFGFWILDFGFGLVGWYAV